MSEKYAIMLLAHEFDGFDQPEQNEHKRRKTDHCTKNDEKDVSQISVHDCPQSGFCDRVGGISTHVRIYGHKCLCSRYVRFACYAWFRMYSAALSVPETY